MSFDKCILMCKCYLIQDIIHFPYQMDHIFLLAYFSKKLIK